MPTEHIVQQGEYLAKIAAQYGFSSYRTIWDHANNAELKRKRKNPNILYPGDKLFIPDRQPREESASTDTRHDYRLKSETLKLRLLVKGSDDEPIANTPCVLIVENRRYEKTTNAAGNVEEIIRRGAHVASLTIRDVEIPLRIGDLDPVEEISGQQARLNNLGYDAGPVDGSDEAKRRSAVEEFQCDHKLKVDGDCGSKTQAKLVEVHGC